MRVIFNEELKAVADGLDLMAKDVRDAIHGSGQALLTGDLDIAQKVIDGDDAIDKLEYNLVDHCIRLLARQNPVATDLRVVVASMRLAATFERMGVLAKHIAESLRRTYPQSPIPPEAQEIFKKMQNFLDKTADLLLPMLSDRDTKTAEQIIVDDKILDDLHHQTFVLVLSDDWHGSKQQLIDVILLGRFMERLGDHAVSVARRVIFIVSGFDPSKDPGKSEDNDLD